LDPFVWMIQMWENEWRLQLLHNLLTRWEKWDMIAQFDMKIFSYVKSVDMIQMCIYSA
jgi:hypothetical protein